MFSLSIQLPPVGRLKRRWDRWLGKLRIAQLEPPLDLWIEVPRREPIEPFAEQAALFASTFPRIQDQLSGELFEAYQFYKKADVEEGAATEADYALHTPPSVLARMSGLLCGSYRLRLGLPTRAYQGNAYLLVDVDWPNPHFFQVYLHGSSAGFEYRHTELVG